MPDFKQMDLSSVNVPAPGKSNANASYRERQNTINRLKGSDALHNLIAKSSDPAVNLDDYYSKLVERYQPKPDYVDRNRSSLSILSNGRRSGMNRKSSNELSNSKRAGFTLAKAG